MPLSSYPTYLPSGDHCSDFYPRKISIAYSFTLYEWNHIHINVIDSFVSGPVITTFLKYTYVITGISSPFLFVAEQFFFV